MLYMALIKEGLIVLILKALSIVTLKVKARQESIDS